MNASHKTMTPTATTMFRGSAPAPNTLRRTGESHHGNGRYSVLHSTDTNAASNTTKTTSARANQAKYGPAAMGTG